MTSIIWILLGLVAGIVGSSIANRAAGNILLAGALGVVGALIVLLGYRLLVRWRSNWRRRQWESHARSSVE